MSKTAAPPTTSTDPAIGWPPRGPVDVLTVPKWLAVSALGIMALQTILFAWNVFEVRALRTEFHSLVPKKE